MWLVDELAEARIVEAMHAGHFENLPGMGEPLPPEQPNLVPEDLKVAYRLLKNAGYSPPEVSLMKEIREVENLLATLDAGDSRSRAARRLSLLQAQLGARAARLDATGYCGQVVQKLDTQPR